MLLILTKIKITLESSNDLDIFFIKWMTLSNYGIIDNVCPTESFHHYDGSVVLLLYHLILSKIFICHYALICIATEL